MNDAACDIVLADLEGYYDSETDRRAFDAHLVGCAECRARLEAVQARLRDLPCRDIVELVTDYLERALDRRLAGRFADHLRLCQGCREYVRQIRLVIALAGSHGKGEGAYVPAGTSDPILEAVLSAFRRRGASIDRGQEPRD